MTETIKLRIKLNAGDRRRKRRNAQGSNQFVLTSAADYATGAAASIETVSAHRLTEPQLPITRVSVPRLRNSEDIGQTQHLGEPRPSTMLDNTTPGSLDLFIKYIDQVIPYLFPFFRAPSGNGSRSFLLTTVADNRAAYRSVLAVTSYYSILTLDENYRGERPTTSADSRDRALQQIRLSLAEIHRDIREPTETVPQEWLQRQQGSLQSMTHLVILTAILGEPFNWDLYLDSAVDLFSQLLGQTRLVSGPSLELLLDAIGKDSRASPWLWVNSWSPNQISFRFFAALLIFADIIGGTARRRQSDLKEHYYHLISMRDDGRMQGERSAPIRFSDVIGCHNWVLVAIAETAALDSWKQSLSIRDGAVQHELSSRAESIRGSLQRGWERRPSGESTGASHNPTLTTTRVWMLAAQAYLGTVTAGWQPESPEIQSFVTEAITLLQDIQDPAWVRSLSWPFCVLGCLAQSTTQEQQFRQIVSRMGKLATIGTLMEGLNIMELVWASRGEGDWSHWGIAACLNILGHPSLLI